MFLFFISLFVPSTVIDDGAVCLKEYEELVNQSLQSEKPIFGLYMNTDTIHHKTINQNVIQATSLYPGMQIEYMTSSSTSLFEDCFSVSPHLLVVLNGGELQYAFPLPEDPGIILRFIEFLNEDEHPIIDNIDDLNMRLGTPSFTLISREKDIKRAEILINESAPTVGFIDLLVVTDEIYNAVVENSSLDFGFFRNEDSVIVGITNNSSSLFDATYPVYMIMRKEDFKSEVPFLIFASETLNETLKQVMYEVGVNSSNISIGWCPPSLQKKLDTEELRNPIDVIMMNPGLNIDYNISSFITNKLCKEGIHNKTEWVITLNTIISNYNGGTLQEIYRSESEPQLMAPQKLVGKTYEKFINDNETDKLIMYMRLTCKHCQKAMSILGDLQDSLDMANITDLKIGFIDISINSCKTPFPKMIGVPHFSLILKNGTVHTIFNERTVSEILRGLSRFLPYIGESGLGQILPDKEDVIGHVLELILSAPSELEGLQKEIMDFAENEMKLVNLLNETSDFNESLVEDNSTVDAEQNSGEDVSEKNIPGGMSAEQRDMTDLLFKKSLEGFGDIFDEDSDLSDGGATDNSENTPEKQPTDEL